MLIQKLRLQRGWSQQQLAEMSGLNVRTIQRLEGGKNPSVETVKSLAAVFEVDFQDLKGALMMNTTTSHTDNNDQTSLTVSKEEEKILKKIEKIKAFYMTAIIYVAVIVLLAIVNWITSPSYWWVVWVILGMGGSLLIKGFSVFGGAMMFSAKWEKDQYDKMLKRK